MTKTQCAFSARGNIDDLDNWNWEIGAGGGEIVVAGVSVVFPGDLSKPFGLGANLGVGAGLLPASLSLSATYGLLLKQ